MVDGLIRRDVQRREAMPKARINGLDTSFYDVGDGAPILFLHSFGHSKLMWLPQLSYFAQKGYRVVAPDFRGHGESGFDPSNHSIEVMADDVLRLLGLLEIKQPTTVGTSMGGYVALRMWAQNSDVIKALVLSNTKAEADTEEIKKRRTEQIRFIRERGTIEFVNAYAARRLSKKTLESRPWVLELVRLMNQPIGEPALISSLQAMMEKPDDTPVLETITVPALVLAGSDDAFIPMSSAFLLRDRIPHAKFAVMEDTGHVSNLEHSSKYNELLEQFLLTVT